jgi:hypothetical protein
MTGRADRRALAVAALAVGTVGAVALAPGGLPGAGAGAGSRASAQVSEGTPTPQTDASVPARQVTMIGASPSEAPDETWGIGQSNKGSGVPVSVLVRYTDSGWSLGRSLLDASGQPLAGFEPSGGALAGRMTADGSGVLVGKVPTEAGESGAGKVVLVRNPGGSFQETAPLPEPEEAPEALLKPGETAFGAHRAPLIAALEEGSGNAGALVVPVSELASGVEDDVLHWNGKSWTREPIEVPAKSKSDFRVLAIGASSPSNAWLLAQLSSEAYPNGSVALFRRRLGEAEAGATWEPVALGPGATANEAFPLTVPILESSEQKPFRVANTGEPPTVQTQILTVTGEGVWIDGERQDVKASTTLFFKPEAFKEGEDWGRVTGSWCPPSTGAPCEYELPQALPTGSFRSIAWPDSSNSSHFGQRVITGFANGVSLRLEGTSFTRVLALGGRDRPNGAGDEVGGIYGAAFSNPREGWLGNERLPVHLTLDPAASRVAPYPVSFRHALVAIAPQPGVPVGSLSSEALAVGDKGEVARFQPGKGWLPESLLTSGGRLATPTLRAVAWPTPARAYAVGDLGQMWLWRGETGLWEPDPATPVNFRGNLLGVAFDPGNPAIGYAVGQGGTLLRYGKTWTQEALPPELADANFTSIAFAGSEAIAAYRQLPDPSTNHYTGGLLVNDGSGWQMDREADSVMGANVPWAVAGLPDGGAAFAAGEASGSGEGAVVFERETAGAPWQQTPTPLSASEPSSLALFREGGSLRAVVSGSVPNTYGLENAPEPPPGFPPNLIPPYPLNAGSGYLLRQTATGWSDEEHEANDVKEPDGSYRFYDSVYNPDPISAVLVDPTGAQGWAVGGFVAASSSTGALETADIERYPADGVPPPGVGSTPIPTEPAKQAIFAIGGDAQCAAPCADLENARIGPDTWLSAALARAGQVPGVRAFLYTGPRVTSGETTGSAEQAVPYASELARYEQLLASSPIPAFAAISPSDRDPASGECTFEQAFSSTLTEALEASERERFKTSCTAESQTYYAISSSGSAGTVTVRVIVLDDGTNVESAQRTWLKLQLQEAAEAKHPAIVVGAADLGAQIAAGDGAAQKVAQTLVEGNASAYFYDSPEHNVRGSLSAVGGAPVATFGSGTLGYVAKTAETSGDFTGASGFLLARVGALEPSSHRAPVSVGLIPNIGELAIEAQGGTLLRRSQAAMFAALARRPRSGNRSQNQTTEPETDPYIPIPSNCIGIACANGLLPQYAFSSSDPEVGDFVKPNLASGEPDAVLLGSNEKPIHDSESGLFCALNAGTTIVTITAGGLSSSLPVTVQAGSVRRPCGTTPLKNVPSSEQASAPAPPAPAPAGPTPAASPLPPLQLPIPPVPAIAPSPLARTPAPPPFLVSALPFAPVPAFVPLPPPTPARPTPPSGTSAVTSPIEVAEHEEEKEEATESVSNQAVAYRAPEHEPAPPYILGIVVLAAFAGASARRRPRRGRHDLRVAPATLSSTRAQRRLQSRRRYP